MRMGLPLGRHLLNVPDPTESLLECPQGPAFSTPCSRREADGMGRNCHNPSELESR